MDVTYFIAGFIAVIVGFCASLVFVLTNQRSKRHLLGFAVLAALAIDGMVLINWTRVGEIPVGFLLLDFAFFFTYSLVGCAVGASVPLALRRLL